MMKINNFTNAILLSATLLTGCERGPAQKAARLARQHAQDSTEFVKKGLDIENDLKTITLNLTEKFRQDSTELAKKYQSAEKDFQNAGSEKNEGAGDTFVMKNKDINNRCKDLTNSQKDFMKGQEAKIKYQNDLIKYQKDLIKYQEKVIEHRKGNVIKKDKEYLAKQEESNRRINESNWKIDEHQKLCEKYQKIIDTYQKTIEKYKNILRESQVKADSVISQAFAEKTVPIVETLDSIKALSKEALKDPYLKYFASEEISYSGSTVKSLKKILKKLTGNGEKAIPKVVTGHHSSSTFQIVNSIYIWDFSDVNEYARTFNEGSVKPVIKSYLIKDKIRGRKIVVKVDYYGIPNSNLKTK